MYRTRLESSTPLLASEQQVVVLNPRTRSLTMTWAQGYKRVIWNLSHTRQAAGNRERSQPPFPLHRTQCHRRIGGSLLGLNTILWARGVTPHVKHGLKSTLYFIQHGRSFLFKLFWHFRKRMIRKLLLLPVHSLIHHHSPAPVYLQDNSSLSILPYPIHCAISLPSFPPSEHLIFVSHIPYLSYLRRLSSGFRSHPAFVVLLTPTSSWALYIHESLERASGSKRASRLVDLGPGWRNAHRAVCVSPSYEHRWTPFIPVPPVVEIIHHSPKL